MSSDRTSSNRFTQMAHGEPGPECAAAGGSLVARP